jgi:alpha-glucosidase
MFPNQGFDECKDQFMLGDKYLVTPIVTADKTRRIVLPKGHDWRDETGKVYKGGQTLTINADMERLPYFEKIRDF